MDIDERIKVIMKKMEELAVSKNPEYPCGEFPPKWDKPFKEERVAKFEEKNGIKIIEDLLQQLPVQEHSRFMGFIVCLIIEEEKKILHLISHLLQQ